uniref:Uncharacterized protein n=1 Tax=Oryza nivara TaxID=4536 RepID=A0A0E0IG99_ORYNI
MEKNENNLLNGRKRKEAEQEQEREKQRRICGEQRDLSHEPIIHPSTPLRTRARFPTIVLATETRAATRNCRGARGVHLSLSDAARSTRITAIWMCFLQ